VSARAYLSSLFLPKKSRPWQWMEWAQLVMLVLGFSLIPWFCSFIPLGLGSRSLTGSKQDDLFYLGLWLALTSIALAAYNLKFDRGNSTVYFHLCAAPVAFLIYWVGLAYWLNGAHFYITHNMWADLMSMDLHPPDLVEPVYTYSVMLFYLILFSPIPYLVIIGALLLVPRRETRRDGLACMAILMGGFAVFWLGMPEYLSWFLD